MARPKVGSDVMPVRFPDGTFARIDAVSGNRSEFIRLAVERALAGGGLPDKGKGVGLEGLPAVPAILAKSASAATAARAVEAGSEVRAAKAARSKAAAKWTTPLREQDKADLLALVRGNMLNSRAAEARLGWPGLRYGNAEKALMDEGRLVVVDGFLEAVE